MKLPQYIHAFAEPLRHEDVATLLTLLDTKHRISKGLYNTVGAIDVSPSSPLAPAVIEVAS